VDGKDAIKVLQAVEKIPPEGGSILVTKAEDGSISTRPFALTDKAFLDRCRENFKKKLGKWEI
jgi:hypothetical protein